MFNKQPENGGFETIIGPSVKVEGDFISDGNVLVEGLVNGSLKTAQHVVVTERAKITANLAAGSAKIIGEINGNVTIQDRLDLAASACVKGDIECHLLAVEAGAKFNGKCTMMDKTTQSKVAADKTQSIKT